MIPEDENVKHMKDVKQAEQVMRIYIAFNNATSLKCSDMACV